MKAASLNHVYRLIWSKIQQAWVAVAEGTRASGKSSLSGQVSEPKESGSQHILGMSLASGTKRRFVIATAFAASLLPMSSFADTNVVAGVVAGDLTIKDISATHTQYTHTANVNIVDFYKFGVLKDHQLDVVMPDAGRALYRVIGNGASEILGKLNSNGSLFLINQNGILFGAGAEVNVGNIVTSTLNISNDDFLQGRYHFTGGDTAGNVINKGVIKAQDEGYIVMLGKKVENEGKLIASKGSVVLASAKEAVLDFYGNGLVRANLTAQAVEGIIKNSGLIQANGGFVQLAANARSAAINVTGIIEANQLVERDGVIRLEGGDNAKVQVSGKLLAKGEHTTGGTIEVTGEQVALLDGAVLDASGDKGGGKVLVGGDYQGKNDAVYNARTSYVAAGATIKADAIEEGDGGKVIVWADDLTRYYGQISAQGGATKGNGGFVEVSGKQNLGFQGKVNVAAANGLGGIVLLDPENIILNNSVQPGPTDNANGTPDVAFADNAGGTTFIQTTNVIGFSELFLQANNNITLDSPLGMLLGGSVRFEANNNININAELGTTLNGNINLKANNDINMNASVITVDGNINLAANNNINVSSAVKTLGKGSIDIKADADNSGTGNVAIGADITGPGGVNLSGATLSHTAGNISASGNALGFGHAGNVTITVAGLADLGNANINANGRPTLLDHGFNGGNVKITAGSVNMTGNINTSGSDAGVLGNPANQGGQGGKVTVAATNTATLGNITTSAGDAASKSTFSRTSGEVTVNSASGDVVVKDVTTKGGFNSTGSNVTLTASNGKVTTGNIDTSAGAGRNNTDGKSAGNVIITAGTGITTQTIIANGANGVGADKSGGAAGAATLKTTNGDIELGAVTVQSGTKTGMGVAGNEAAILAEAGNNINVNGNVTNDKGTVTLKADADNSGAGNLAIKANITGPGNVNLSGATLTHTAGNISSAGNTAGFGHAGNVTITVAGLADLGSANIVATGRTASSTEKGFNGGNVKITAGSANMTGSINTSGSNAGATGNQGGQGGTVTVVTTNNASIGNITTSAGDASSGSTLSRTSGEVNVTSTSGDVGVKDVTTKGGFNSTGANVILTANNGKVTTGNIDTSAGAGRNNTDGKSAGNVNVTAGTGIATQTIIANGANGVDGVDTNKSGGAAGTVTLKTAAGNIDLGAVNVQAGTKTGIGVAGNAADILAEAGNNINVNGNVTNDKGIVTLKADADNSGAGNLAIGANITGPGGVNLSGATLTHTAGNISSAGNTAGFGHAGNVTITVAGLADLGSANIVATGRTATGTENGFNGGNVQITSTAGSANLTGSINTSGSAAGAKGNQGGQGGKVTVLTENNANIGNITTSAGDAASGSTVSRPSGEVKVTSTSGDVVVKDVTTKGGFNSFGANVSLAANKGKVTTGNIDTSAGAGRDNTDGKSAGNVDIIAGTGVTTQTITANGANGVGADKSGGGAGSVTVRATSTTGDVRLGAVTVQSGAKTGNGIAGNTAKILAEAGRDLYLTGDISSNSNAPDAVVLVAGYLNTTNGRFNNSSNSNINITGGGKWTVFAHNPNPTDSTNGANLLAAYDYKQYGTAYVKDKVPDHAAIGDGFVYQITPTFVANLSGTSTKVFDGNNIVTDLSGLSSTSTLAGVSYNNVALSDKAVLSPLVGATFNDPSVGTGKPITSAFTLVSLKTFDDKPIYLGTGQTFATLPVTTNSTATGTILPVPFASPRDNAGLGGLIPNNPALNTMTIVSLNPAAGDEEDLDAVACPVNEDSLGSTPVLNSGVKLPDGVSSNCI